MSPTQVSSRRAQPRLSRRQAGLMGAILSLSLIGTAPAIAQSDDSFDPYESYRSRQSIPPTDEPANEPYDEPYNAPTYAEPSYTEPSDTEPFDTEPPHTEPPQTAPSDSRWLLTSDPDNHATPNSPPNSASISTPRPEIAPFYLSAQQYLEQRAAYTGRQGPYEVTKLTYSVSSERINAINGKRVIIGISDDFAYQTEQGSASILIYDFALNRIIELGHLTAREPSFVNHNMLPNIQRNVERINALTQLGNLRDVSQNGQNYDAFWLESEARYSAAISPAGLEIEKPGLTFDQPAKFIARYEGEPVVEAQYSDEIFSRAEQSNIMRHYAHFNWPIHPQIIETLFTDRPLESLKFKSSEQASGTDKHWTLTAREQASEPFPLPPNAQLETQALPKLLITALQNAAHAKQDGGQRSIETIAQNIRSALRRDDYLVAWLEGQSYRSYGMNAQITRCPHDDVCEAMDVTERQADNTPELAAMIKNFSDASTTDGRLIAAQRLNSWLDENPPHPAILRTLAKTMMSLDPALAQIAGLNDVNIGEMLITALAIDPFNKQNYLGLAQYYLAHKQFDNAWNIYDSMRSLLSEEELSNLTIDKVESELETKARGYLSP